MIPDIEIDAIWQDDLLNRKDEATALIGYIESVSDGESANHAAFTLAIDARYGHGKTFFLQRLAKQLSYNHPVALVDAWTDDLADEPLIALIATLKKALDPYIENSENLSSKWKKVLWKTGDVAKITAKGLLKRGIGLLITGAAVEAAEQIITGVSDDVVDAIHSNLEDVGSEAVEGGSSALNRESSQNLMERRVREFEDGQRAIDELKASLRDLVASLSDEVKSAPIIIIIDELDRCRPTYAIKLLEEIKHLFDVEGLVFIFGMHGQQLAHSINAAYGSSFDGPSYLRRFIQRRYTLAEPDLEPFIASLISSSGLDISRISYPRYRENGSKNKKSPAGFISSYMTAYGLTARDAFELVDILKTAVTISSSRQLIGPYLLPLAIGQLKRLDMGQLPAVIIEPEWKLIFTTSHQAPEEISIGDAARRYQQATQMSPVDMAANRDNTDPIRRLVANQMNDWGEFESDAVTNYPKMLAMVRRLTNSAIASPS